MKFISGLFKFFAVLTMAFIVVALPVSIGLRGLNRLIFSPETVVALLDQNLFDADVLAGVVEVSIQELNLTVDGGADPAGDMIAMSLKNMSHSDWVDIIELIAPPELISDSFEQILTGYYRWIDGPDAVPHIVIDFAPWKRNLAANAFPVVEMVVNRLPQCTPEQLNQYAAMNNGLGESGAVPLCRPPEPFYSAVLDQVAQLIPERVREMPNQVDLSERIQFDRQALAQSKQNLLRLKRITNLALPVVLVVFLVAVPMGARSLQGAFKWSGWPLGLAGGLGLFGGLLIMVLGGGMVEGFQSEAFAELPAPLFEPLVAVASTWTLSLARFLLLRSALLIVLGVGALVAAWLLGRSHAPVQTAGPDTSTLVELPPAGTPAAPSARQEPDRNPDDESSPSGMFG